MKIYLPLFFNQSFQTISSNCTVSSLINRVHEDNGCWIIASAIIHNTIISLINSCLPAILANPSGQSDVHLPPCTSGLSIGQMQ